VELSGRIKKSFGIEGHVLRVKRDSTIETLAHHIHKMIRRDIDEEEGGGKGEDHRGVISGKGEQEEGDEEEVEEEEEEDNRPTTITTSSSSMSKGDLIHLMASQFEDKVLPAPCWRSRGSSSSSNSSSALLFGATGLIGAHVLERLLKKGVGV